MYKVYFDNKVIVFTHRPAPAGYAVWSSADGETGITKVLQKLENNKRLYVVSTDPRGGFENFCSLFTTLEAAGGLVRNPQGEALMILRNNRWDLPKGHLEQGENTEECAAREVCEETGVCGVHSGGLLHVTFHIYPFGEQWILKKTWWYAMRHPGTGPLVPQLEEGITSVQWLSGEVLEGALRTTYSTIREVFRKEKTKK